MSLQETSWAMAQEGISSRAKFVLLVLSNSSCNFRADYTMPYLAKATLLPEPAVHKALMSLQRAGCIKYFRIVLNDAGKPERYEAVLDEARA